MSVHKKILICIPPDLNNLIKIVLIGLLGNALPSDGIEEIGLYVFHQNRYEKTDCTKVMMNISKLHIVKHSEIVGKLITRINKGRQSMLMCKVQSWNHCMAFNEEIKIGPIYERCGPLIWNYYPVTL